MYPQLSSLLPNHHCRIPSLEAAGWLEGGIATLAIPKVTVGNKTRFSHCYEYNMTGVFIEALAYFKENMTDLTPKQLEFIEKRLKLHRVPCQNGWWYDDKNAKFQRSFPEEFNMVCSHRYLVPISTSVYLVGTMIGRTFGGFVADIFGRKPVMLAASVSTFALGILVGVSPNAWAFCIFRFFVGITSNAAIISGLVLWSEIVDDHYRNFMGVLFGVHESFIIPSFNVLLAYLTQNWRTLHMLLVVYYGFSFIHICLIRDSPRWLLTKGRIDDAWAVIQRAITWNRGRGAFSEDDLQGLRQRLEIEYGRKAEESKASEATGKDWRHNKLLVLFTLPALRSFMLPFLCVWFVIMMGALGFAFYAVRLKHNSPYVIAFVGFLVSLPAMAVKFLLYNYFDRKRPLIGVFLVCATSCFVQAVLRWMHVQGIAEASLATLSLCCILVAQNMAYTYNTECFPTACRNYAVGLGTGLGRLGAVAATFIARLDSFVWAPLPMIIFGIASVGAAIAVLNIPATNVTKLHDQLMSTSSDSSASDSDSKKPASNESELLDRKPTPYGATEKSPLSSGKTE